MKMPSAAILLVFVLTASCGLGNEPETVPVESYDTSCAAHSECVLIEPCVCNCDSACGPAKFAINEASQLTYESDRAAIQCLESEQALSCAPTYPPYCVEGTCRMLNRNYDVQEDPPGPDDWQRTCNTSSDCAFVRTENKCSLSENCGTLDVVNRISVDQVRNWRLDCDQFTNETCEPEPTNAIAYCDQGMCNFAVGPDEPAPGTNCTDFDDELSCIEAGCRPTHMPGWELDANDECTSTTRVLCAPRTAGSGGSANAGTPHVRDGFATTLFSAQPWGFRPCNGEAVCECIGR